MRSRPDSDQLDAARRILEELIPDRIVLSGGDDLRQRPDQSHGDEPRREDVESLLLALACEHSIPVLGICRGMQSINAYFGGGISRLTSDQFPAPHLPRSMHPIVITDDQLHKCAPKPDSELTVNSYHNQAIRTAELSPSLRSFAEYRFPNDLTRPAVSIVEGLFHPDLPIAGIQWHPERESPRTSISQTLIDAFFAGTLYWRLHNEGSSTYPRVNPRGRNGQPHGVVY